MAEPLSVVIIARNAARSLPACLQTLDGISAEDSRIALLFKTHPLPADRLVKLDETRIDYRLGVGRYRRTSTVPALDRSRGTVSLDATVGF